MRINGLWLRDPEQPGIVRPVITAKLLFQDQELPIVFLIDTGAGGQLDFFLAAVRLEFQDVDNRPIKFSTSCVILTDPNQRNEHLLGRDILDYFALICAREANQVTLLRPPHHYAIHG